MAVRRTITPHEVFRRRAGLGVVELAQGLGVSHTYVSRVESGEITPSVRYREAVAEVLGVRSDVLFPTGGERVPHGAAAVI